MNATLALPFDEAEVRGPSMRRRSSAAVTMPDTARRDLALLRFDYDGLSVDPGDRRQRLRRVEDGRILVIERTAERLLGGWG